MKAWGVPVAVVALALAVGGCAAPAATTTEQLHATLADRTSSSVGLLGYHGDYSRTGAFAADPALDQLKQAWSVSLPGGVHNQPVFADNLVIVADESNHVSALDPSSGALRWQVSLGKPLTRVVHYAGCGDIDPLGITSTPVIDDTTDVVYVVGEVLTSPGHVQHKLEGIDIGTGHVVLSERVDPPLPHGESAIHLLQRASLALANGRVYIGYGGNDGDCGSYHGWVVGVNETGAKDLASFEVASDGQGGAIWQGGGAPAVDAAGDLYVTTGNANPDPPQGGPDPKKYTESVVKLSPTLTPLASFKDEIAGGDEDLSTGNPVLLPGGNVFSIGKTRVGYVLRQSDLTEVAAIPHICGSDPDGGPAYDATLDEMFVPCRDGGIQPVYLGSAGSASPPNGDAPVVETRLSGANSAPILVGQNLWALSYQTNALFEYNTTTDAQLQSSSFSATIAHFETPAAVDGLLLVGTSHGLVAFGSAAAASVAECDPVLAARLGLGCV
jgi:polyvinyl alcohol dehydrogenase (cytochrome)